MKTFILLFLVSWFQCMNISENCQTISKSTQIVDTLSNQNVADIKRDSLDIKTLKKLKMTKYFSYHDRQYVRNICDSLGIETKHLYKIIKIESGGNRKALNKKSKAAGLIGFIPKTAKVLGTNTNEILNMSNQQQLDLTYKYLKLMLKGRKLDKLSDLYLAVLYPNALHRSDSYVIGEKGSNAAKWNKPLDMDRDSILTVKDVKAFVTLI